MKMNLCCLETRGKKSVLTKAGLAFLALLLCVGLLPPDALAQSWSSVGPIPRALHSAVFDPSTNRMIVYGGLPFDTNSLQNLGDVWRFTGGLNSLSWLQMHPTGPAPTPRWGQSAVYDGGSNRMIIFGGAEGRSSPCANDVWALTDANGNGGTPAWIQLSTAGTAPAPRTSQGGVYDPNTNSLILYGGQDCFSTLFSDVWVLSNANGIGGTPTWTQLSPSGSAPGAREIGQSMVYDSAHNTLIIFGGGNGGGSGRTNDTWILSNANGTGGTPAWTQLSPTGTLPPARGANSAIYDPASNRMTIFGGNDASGNLFGDAWVLTNANGQGGTPTWTQLAASSTDFPDPRYGNTAVYVPSVNSMVVFGGVITMTNTLATSNVWVLSRANGL